MSVHMDRKIRVSLWGGTKLSFHRKICESSDMKTNYISPTNVTSRYLTDGVYQGCGRGGFEESGHVLDAKHVSPGLD